MRAILFVASLVWAGSAYSQSPLSFEAASIKPAQPLTGPLSAGMRMGCGGGPGTSDPGSWRCNYVGLSDLILKAYDLQRYQFTPADWMITARFDIIAKVPAGTTKEQLLEMQRTLLAERFKLAVHHEQKEMQIYELAVAKNGPKLKETSPDNVLVENEPGVLPKLTLGADKFPMFASGRGGMIGLNGRFRWASSNVTTAAIAKELSPLLGRQVVDVTGLTGKYDINMYWIVEGIRMAPATEEPPPAPPGPSLEAAVQEQLGLKFNAKKGPVDILVVDHAEKVPIEN